HRVADNRRATLTTVDKSLATQGCQRAAEQVMRLLRSLADDDGIAVAGVLHQPDLARRHADRIVGLTGGRITPDTAPSALTHADVDALYAPDYAIEGGLA